MFIPDLIVFEITFKKTNLSSTEFFDLLSTLNQLTNDLNQREETTEKMT